MAPTFFRLCVWFFGTPGPREFNSYRANFFFKSCGILCHSTNFGGTLTTSIRTFSFSDFSVHNSMFLHIFGCQRPNMHRNGLKTSIQSNLWVRKRMALSVFRLFCKNFMYWHKVCDMSEQIFLKAEFHCFDPRNGFYRSKLVRKHISYAILFF